MSIEVILIALVAFIVISLIMHTLFNIKDIQGSSPKQNGNDDEGGLDKFYDFPVVIFPPSAPLDLLLQDRKPEHLYDLTKEKKKGTL